MDQTSSAKLLALADEARSSFDKCATMFDGAGHLVVVSLASILAELKLREGSERG
jgi:hypothetical protein